MAKYRLVKESGKLWCECKYPFWPIWLRMDVPFDSIEQFREWIRRKNEGYYKPQVIEEVEV